MTELARAIASGEHNEQLHIEYQQISRKLLSTTVVNVEICDQGRHVVARDLDSESLTAAEAKTALMEENDTWVGKLTAASTRTTIHLGSTTLEHEQLYILHLTQRAVPLLFLLTSSIRRPRRGGGW